MSYAGLLIHRCKIYRHTEAQKGNFSKTEVQGEPLYTDVHCRMSQSSTTIATDEHHAVRAETYRLHLLRGQDIKAGDVVEVDGFDGRWEVGAPYPPSGRFIVVSLKVRADV